MVILDHLDVFRDLCSDLKEHYGLKATRNVSIEESLGIFLFILAHGSGNRLAQETFNHSGETIHRHFHKVLKAVLKLSGDIIKPNANYNEEVPPQILNNSRYYPMFKNCIRAIDGTHVRASVREHEQAKYIGRKGYATQNIMAACDFNMCFTFVWAGWEGTAHDTRIFLEALRRPQVNFPRPTGDKYYVVDVGYPNTKEYLAPYKGNDIRYHILDFCRAQTSSQRAPKGKKRHLTTITCNSQVKDCKIDLLTQEYEKFSISDVETIDSSFTRFNAIVTSLKSLYKDYSNKNHVRKFLRALPNDGIISKSTKEKVKSLALKAKVTRGQTSNDSICQDGSDVDEDKEEEFNSIVKNLWKLVKKGNRFERENRFVNGGDRFDRGHGNRSEGVRSSRGKRNCYGCGSKNHFVDDCPKAKIKKAFVGGAWSDSEDGDQMEKDATCRMAIGLQKVNLNPSVTTRVS
ncbi:putative nuclease HARBI1 isoform X1 [Tanacetum coccineum]